VIGVFERWHRIFPGTALRKPPAQGFAARDQAVMGVGQRESWKEANRYATYLALATTIANPVVTVVVGLFRSPAVADDGITST
jgi:hypothetical protein